MTTATAVQNTRERQQPQRASGELAIRDGQDYWEPKQLAALSVLGISGATEADLAVYFHYCQRTGLDPFSKQIYMIERRTQEDGKWVSRWTIQVGIEGFRVIRDRAAERLGVDVEYSETIWYDDSGNGHKIWLSADPPAGCSMTVYKDGKPFPAVLSFREYMQVNRDGKLTGKWRDAPAHQIEKCCEAFALRRAFPHDLAGVHIPEEMGSEGNGQPTARPPRRVLTGKAEPAHGTRAAARRAGAPEPGPGTPEAIDGHLERLGYPDAGVRAGMLTRLAGREITATADLDENERAAIGEALAGCKTRRQLDGLLDEAAGGNGGGDGG